MAASARFAAVFHALSLAVALRCGADAFHSSSTALRPPNLSPLNSSNARCHASDAVGPLPRFLVGLNGERHRRRHRRGVSIAVGASSVAADDIEDNAYSGTIRSLTIAKEVASLGLPALGGMLIDPIMSLVDTACVGQVSSVQLASLAPCTSICQFFFNVFFFLSAATTNLLAATPINGDEKDEAEVRRRSEFHERVVSGAALAAFALGIVTTAGIFVWSDQLLVLAGCSSDVAMLNPARQYLQIRALGIPLLLVATVLQGASLGLQDAMTPLRIFASAGVINLVGDVYLTLNRGWGVVGAAAATVAAQIAAALYFIYKSWRRPPLTAVSIHGKKNRRLRGVRLAWRGFPTRKIIGSFATVASTLLLRSIVLMLAYSLMTRSAAKFGTTALAAHQVVLQVWWLLSYIPEPMTVTAQSLVARDTAAADAVATNEREGELARLRLTKLVRVLCCMAAAAGVLVAAMTGFVLASSTIAKMLVADTSVHALMARIAPFAILAQILAPLNTVSEGVCVGAGAFRHLPVMIIGSIVTKIFALWVVGRRGLGLEGIWICFNIWQGVRILGNVLFGKKLRDLLLNKHSPTLDMEATTMIEPHV